MKNKAAFHTVDELRDAFLAALRGSNERQFEARSRRVVEMMMGTTAPLLSGIMESTRRSFWDLLLLTTEIKN